MDICDIGVYDQFCYAGKTCKADKRQCLSTYYLYDIVCNQNSLTSVNRRSVCFHDSENMSQHML